MHRYCWLHILLKLNLTSYGCCCCRYVPQACKHNASAPGQSSDDPGSMAWAARQLGVHYLKRYFLLIAFRCVECVRRGREGVCVVYADCWSPSGAGAVASCALFEALRPAGCLQVWGQSVAMLLCFSS